MTGAPGAPAPAAAADDPVRLCARPCGARRRPGPRRSARADPAPPRSPRPQASVMIRAMMDMMTGVTGPGAGAAPGGAAAAAPAPAPAAAPTLAAVASAAAPPLLLALHDMLQRLQRGGGAGGGAPAAEAPAPAPVADPARWREHQAALTTALRRVLAGEGGAAGAGMERLDAQPTGQAAPGSSAPPGAGCLGRDAAAAAAAVRKVCRVR